MLEIVIGILLLCLLTYTIFAGADLGTGILEIFTSKRDDNKQYCLSTHALKPVWEINHIWLGLAVIIIFIVFPKAFYKIFTTFALPVLFMFFGLFVRGFAFSLKSLPKYVNNGTINKLFDYSSLWSTFWMGNFIGALIQGNAMDTPESFYQGFIAPWLGLFPILTGLFLIALYAFLAAIFLHTETENELLQSILKRRAINANIFAIVIGGVIFIHAFFLNEGITFYFLQSRLSLLAFCLANILLIPGYIFLKHNNKFVMQTLASTQILLILIGLFGAQFPIIFQTNLDNQPKTYTFYNTIAENTSMTALLAIVVMALLVTLPTYYYLYKVYRKKLDNLFQGNECS
jgi:cytochrome d ubiquinol oxidase subunit II